MVSSLPCATYAKNAETDTRIGAQVQMSEKQIELIRATVEQKYECVEGMLNAKRAHL